MFSQQKLLEIEQVTSTSKAGCFTANANSLYFKNLLWVPTKALRKEVLASCHDHVLSGHPGIAGTMLLIKQDYVWFGMKAQVATFVKACNSCNRNKPSNCKPTGLLMPLQIPDAPWSSISVDFITNLPLSNGAGVIMVVVDRFTKWAEFFPCSKSITAQGAASIFLKEVFSHHGLLKEIISG